MNALRRRSVRIAIAAVVTALATTAWMPAVVLHPDDRVLREASDASSTARDYWSMTERGTNPLRRSTIRSWGAPEGTDVLLQIAVANALQPLFVWSVKSVTGILGAINLFMLLGLVLTGTVTYALLDRLGVHPLAAAFGAYAFTFNTYLLRKIVYGHGSLVHAWVFPALVLAWLELRRRRTPRPRRSSSAPCWRLRSTCTRTRRDRIGARGRAGRGRARPGPPPRPSSVSRRPPASQQS